jgi:hypothetical protein
MISEAAIASLARKIEARDGVSATRALQKAQAWAAAKNAPGETQEAREARLKAEGKCILPIDLQRGGKISPRCPCPACGGPGGDIDARHRAD